MRPLKLTLAGLRSYTEKQSIDFTERNLVAIVGDTGAGKSSLLEAITYALYGRSTWSGQPGDLISDYATTMAVELEFLADGGHWRATRSMSSNSIAAVHRLERLHKNERYDGRSAVNNKITELVGLDDEAFLKTVLLPQGEFDRLLKATRGQRTAILKGIFSLDVLERARTSADGLLRELGPRLELLRERRKDFPDDPESEAKDPDKKAAEAQSLGLRLEALKSQIDDVMHRIDVCSATARSLHMAADRLEDEGLRQTLGNLNLVSEAATILEGELVIADDELAGARQASAKARDQLATAELVTGNRTTLTSLKGKLVSMSEALERLRESLARLKAARELAHAGSDGDDEARRKAEAAEQEAKTAASLARNAKEFADTASSSFERADLVLRRLVEASTAIQGAEEKRLHANDEAKKASQELRAAEDLAALRRGERELARGQLGDLQRAHSAAHASLDLVPGDDCPICGRPIQDGFVPPAAQAIDLAEEKARKAQEDYEAAVAARERAFTLSEQANAHSTSCADQLSEAASTLTIARHDAAEALKLDSGAVAIKSEGEAEAILAPMRLRRDEATKEAERLASQERTKSDEAVRAAEGRRSAAQLWAERQEALQTVDREVQNRKRNAQEFAGLGLPKEWLPSVDGLDEAISQADGGIIATDVAQLLDRLDARLDELEELEKERDRADAAERAAQQEHDRVALAWDEQISKPVQAGLLAASRLIERANQVAELVGETKLPDTGADPRICSGHWNGPAECFSMPIDSEPKLRHAQLRNV